MAAAFIGLARNERLVEEIAVELIQTEAEAEHTGKPARRFRDFRHATLKTWSRRRRVVGKAEWTACPAAQEWRLAATRLQLAGGSPA